MSAATKPPTGPNPDKCSPDLTRQEILDGWLPDFLPAPDGSTLTRWLVRTVQSGQVRRAGTGRRNDAFRYWLPAREERWRQHPFYEIKEQLEEEARRRNADDLGPVPPAE